MMRRARVSFNGVFKEANESVARYKVLMGSAGSGKSYNTAQDLIIKLSDRRYTGANLLVVRKTERSNKSSTFAELSGAVKRIFGGDSPKFWRITEEPMMLESLVTGSRILFRGMNDASQRERVKSISYPSGKLTWIWCEEATELTSEDFELLDDRLRGDLSLINPELFYQITLTFNPVSSDHWIKKRFFDTPPDSDVYLHKSLFGDNPFLDDGFHKRMARRAKFDADGYKVYGLGEWGGGSGLILTNWRVADLSDDPSCYDAMWMAQDFGFNHHNCLLLLGAKDGVLYVIRELYVRLMDTSEIIAAAEAVGFDKELPMFCDSAEPDRIKMWQRAGWKARAAKKGPGSVAAQIDFLKQCEIVVDGSCKSVIRELQGWHWQKDPVSGEYTDVPDPVEDDAMAALRYGTQMLMGGLLTISKKDLGL